MTLRYDVEVPHIIKYMGSKKQIIDFVVNAINDVYTHGTVCDLFAGSAVLSGTLRNQTQIISNDIQHYSSILANMYLANYDWDRNQDILDNIVESANRKVTLFREAYPDLMFNYNQEFTLTEFNELEQQQRNLINMDFPGFDYHLFIKYYSGTYWSFEQCLWIDSLRAVADEYINTPFYYTIIACLMFAMSYNSQSTGHYAQYRDATNTSSMNDILIYRRKEILPFFIRKFKELRETLSQNNNFNYQIVSMDYLDCLDIIPPNTVVYADPPYCFVHYSRFYHAIETLVRYDYPEVRYKGRYRTDRHQSPFCIRSQVHQAFRLMFDKIAEKEANLVLSYSDTGMIALDELINLASDTLGTNYEIEVRYQDYLHSTMGRKEDKSRDVRESLILAKRRT
jgi:adenine-specific DNA-methyltransferase